MRDSLGSRMRSRRTERGLKLTDVADATGLSMQYVSNLERDRGNPTLKSLAAIAGALGTTVAALVGDDVDVEDETDELVLATVPTSLVTFSRTDRFESVVEQLGRAQGVGREEMRRRVLVGMASAPRRSAGEPTRDDWQRLLDAYRLILDEA